MAHRKYQISKNTCNEDRPRNTSTGYSNKIRIFPFLFHEYGSLEFILNLADSILDFLKKILYKRKKLHRVLSVLQYGIPAVVFISDLIGKLRKFQQIKSGKNDVSNENAEKYKELFNVTTKVNIEFTPFLLGGEITKWLLQRPTTKDFKVLGYYQFDTLQPIADSYREDDSTLVTALEMNGIKFAWVLRMYRTTDGDLYLRYSDVYAPLEHISKVQDLKGKIFREFIQHFDVTSNVLLLSPGGLSTYPRQEIIEQPYQYDTKRLANEIKKTLKRKKKRGWVLVGLPGTGKSTIIHSLELLVKEYPIVYLSSDCFRGSSIVKETFETIRYIQPCLIVIEDLDSCELKEKNQALGELLEQVDDVDNKLNIAIVTSVNDTSMVHYSLINRPGRLDEVIFIQTPQSVEEVYSILKCRYYKNQTKDPEIKEEFMSHEDINPKYIQEILDKEYTQADVCELVEKSLLISNGFTNETLRESMNSLNSSKIALKKCDFGGVTPKSKDAPDECIAEEKHEARMGTFTR